MCPNLITCNKNNVRKHNHPTVRMGLETQELLHSLQSTKTSLGCPEMDGTFHGLFTVSEYSTLWLYLWSSPYFKTSEFLLLPTYFTL